MSPDYVRPLPVIKIRVNNYSTSTKSIGSNAELSGPTRWHFTAVFSRRLYTSVIALQGGSGLGQGRGPLGCHLTGLIGDKAKLWVV